MALVTLSTVSANKEKKCLVKSGKDNALPQNLIAATPSDSKALSVSEEIY